MGGKPVLYLIIILGGIKSKKMRKTLIYLASLLLSTSFLVSCGSCTVAPFPIVIGGSVGDTYLYQMDYHALTDRIVGVGCTSDWGMSTYKVGSCSPIITVYQGPLMTYLWGKSLAIMNDYYVGVTFSEDGTYIVAVI